MSEPLSPSQRVAKMRKGVHQSAEGRVQRNLQERDKKKEKTREKVGGLFKRAGEAFGRGINSVREKANNVIDKAREKIDDFQEKADRGLETAKQKVEEAGEWLGDQPENLRGARNKVDIFLTKQVERVMDKGLAGVQKLLELDERAAKGFETKAKAIVIRGRETITNLRVKRVENAAKDWDQKAKDLEDIAEAIVKGAERKADKHAAGILDTCQRAGIDVKDYDYKPRNSEVYEQEVLKGKALYSEADKYHEKADALREKAKEIKEEAEDRRQNGNECGRIISIIIEKVAYGKEKPPWALEALPAESEEEEGANDQNDQTGNQPAQSQPQN